MGNAIARWGWIARLVYNIYIYTIYTRSINDLKKLGYKILTHTYIYTLWLFNSVTVCELEAMAHL